MLAEWLLLFGFFCIFVSVFGSLSEWLFNSRRRQHR